MSLYPTDDKVREDYLSLYRWQWLKHLAEKKVYELHCEIFEYFGEYPGDLHRLHWREFEELLDSIFRNQGYYTELGPGRNDGGVDIRLYQHKGIPEVVTGIAPNVVLSASGLTFAHQLINTTSGSQAVTITNRRPRPGDERWPLVRASF